MCADTFKYVQAQSFALAGGGAVAGATSITLKSFTQIDGTLLTMTDFGSVGFITLEPGNSTLEEQISFTGVTQNANGTATLTGVSTILMVHPYTATSGLAQTHAGSTTAVVSNTSGFYDRLTSKNDDETITGVWTFTNPNYPRMDTDSPDPTDNEQLVPKSYVDNVVVSGAPDANTTTKGLVEIATQAEEDAGTATGGTGASIVATPAITRSRLLSDYVLDTGTANNYAIAPNPTISAYANGQRFTFKVLNTNTGTAIIAVNALAGTLIFKGDGTVGLAPGDFVAGQIVEIVKAPNGFQLETPPASISPAGAIQMYAGVTAPTGWLLCDGTSYVKSTYQGLFDVIGTTYGSADSAHFNVPDLRGRVPVGVGTGTGGGASGTGLPTGGAALTAVARGTWEGEETHTLTTPEMPAHTHTLTNFYSNTTGGGSVASTAYTSGPLSGQLSTDSTGGGGAHNTIQPVMGLQFIIKT